MLLLMVEYLMNPAQDRTIYKLSIAGIKTILATKRLTADVGIDSLLHSQRIQFSVEIAMHLTSTKIITDVQNFHIKYMIWFTTSSMYNAAQNAQCSYY